MVDTRVTLASGTAERDAAITMMEHKPAGKRVTLGGDRGYDTQAFVGELRELQVTPHVAQNTTNRRSAIDERTTRHEGYTVTQRKRKRVEEVFGWMKTIALQRKTRFRGPDRVGASQTNSSQNEAEKRYPAALRRRFSAACWVSGYGKRSRQTGGPDPPGGLARRPRYDRLQHPTSSEQPLGESESEYGRFDLEILDSEYGLHSGTGLR